MGLNLENQVNMKKYFSISTIDKTKMKEAGLTMTAKELKEIARRTPP